MSTTKKVAPKVRAVKSAPVVKKRPHKVIAPSEFTPLIELKNTVKKTRAVAKKAVPKVEKKVILSDTERSQLQPRGSQVVEFLVALPKISLSPSSVQIVSITSRTIGVFIACIGIAYSLFGSLIGVNALTQTAQLPNYASTTEQILDCALDVNFLHPECENSVNKKPLPVVTIADGGTSLTGQVPVIIAVNNAQIVRFRLIGSDGQPVSTWLNTDFNTTTNDWRRMINTVDYPSGQYRLNVYVSNSYGGYDSLTQTTYTFYNQPNTNTGNAGGVATTTTSTTTTNTLNTNQTLSQINISSVTTNVTESADIFTFTAMVASVEKVIFSAVHVETGKIYTIGDAKEVKPGEWRRVWDTGSLPFGQYRIKVRAVTNTDSKTIESIFVKKIQATTFIQIPIAQETVVTQPVLKPPVSISVLGASPLRGMVGIAIDVAHASSVELALQPKNALRYSSLGRAVRSSATTWIYRFDTAMLPDGEYNLKALVKNQYGEYETIKSGIAVKNLVEKVLTETETEQIKILETIAPKVATEPLTTKPTTSVAVNDDPAVLTPAQPETQEVEEKEEPALTSPFEPEEQTELQRRLDRLSVAIRMEDQAEVTRITEEIAAYKATLGDLSDQKDLVESYISDVIKATEEKVARTNTIIEERTKQKAAQDSDQDKVSDYDEVNLYGTNPFLADSDNDGFIDGVEILRGFDPTNSEPETLVQFESPKESGVVREDILKIKSITSAPPLSDTEPVTKDAAVISGIALPNSFITLYIYSTPIIVTIKTDADGSWNYRLDKELEDGEHEMYIGVTDNAGKIVAKSSSFAFVKRAEAFNGVVVDTPATVSSEEDSNLLSEYVVYLVLGISTLAIGLILMMLGLQLQARKPEVISAE